ncbi:UpxY family transcription antiterminator [Polaribacter sp. Q13]|uniref:UpxY family transcription antiterminator n=1 Tax=Polaribacter sp. Q13 TaxID=2806551 RepID=UPI00193C571D|nr:UpxY family transcription antiterminator [Polaribacter sp. Q13]QVY66634.1 UpxY family transcription antiterminator [Polaribacter sp. Q13]
MNLPKKTTKDKQWFAVFTRPKAEKKVEERLSKAGFEVFLPLQTVVKQWSDRKKKMQVPLINSYVFVQATQKELLAVYPIIGVVSILKYLGTYAVVKDTEIENLRILSNNTNLVSTICTRRNRMAKGTKITVLEGPFKGLHGTYLTHAGKNMVIIEMETLGTCVEVTLPIQSLEKNLIKQENAVVLDGRN